MSSNLKVNTILPSTGTAIGIGTASGNVDVLGHIVGNNTSNISWSHRDKTRSLILFLSSSERLTAYPHNLNVFKELECRPCFRDNPDRSYGSLGPKTPCDNPPNQSYENPIHECGNIDPMYISNIVRQVI